MTNKLKRQISIAFCCLGFGSLALAQQTDTLVLSLDKAVEIGLADNETLQAARLDVGRAQYDHKVNLAQLFPNISASGSYGYTLKKQKVYFGGGDSNNPMASFLPEGGIEMGQTHNIQAGINASLPLFAPQLWASLGLDRVSVEIAKQKAQGSIIDLTAELRKAYMGVLLAQDSKRVLEESLENMKRNRTSIQQKYDRGLVAEYDLIRMDAQVKNLIPQVIQATQSVRLAEMKLLVLMSMSPERPIKLEEKLSDYIDTVYSNMLAKGRMTDTLDFKENKTLRSLALNAKQLEAALKAKKSAFLPTLAMSFNYTYNYADDNLRLSNSLRWSPYSMIGLSLSVPIFAGGSRLYGLKSTGLQILQLELQRRQAERELRLAASSSTSEQRNASEQFVASQEAVRSAQKGLDIAEVRYRTGESTILELNDAELALRQAQLNLYQAIYNYMIATYSLAQLQGDVPLYGPEL